MDKKKEYSTAKKFDPMSAKVIDGDNNKILEWFDPADIHNKVAEYKAKGNWDDVSVDRDGDIILWEE